MGMIKDLIKDLLGIEGPGDWDYDTWAIRDEALEHACEAKKREEQKEKDSN